MGKEAADLPDEWDVDSDDDSDSDADEVGASEAR